MKQPRGNYSGNKVQPRTGSAGDSMAPMIDEPSDIISQPFDVRNPVNGNDAPSIEDQRRAEELKVRQQVDQFCLENNFLTSILFTRDDWLDYDDITEATTDRAGAWYKFFYKWSKVDELKRLKEIFEVGGYH